MIGTTIWIIARNLASEILSRFVLCHIYHNPKRIYITAEDQHSPFEDTPYTFVRDERELLYDTYPKDAYVGGAYRPFCRSNRASPGLERAGQEPLKRGSPDICPRKQLVMLIVVRVQVGICFLLMPTNCVPHPDPLATQISFPIRWKPGR